MRQGSHSMQLACIKNEIVWTIKLTALTLHLVNMKLVNIYMNSLTPQALKLFNSTYKVLKKYFHIMFS